MKEVVRKDILGFLEEAVEILQVRKPDDPKELKTLSNKVVESVALQKDLDLISVSVLIYSIYKILPCIQPQDYSDVVKKLSAAKNSLKQNNFSVYNRNIKVLYNIVRKCNAQVKEHLQDIMQAARIKKGTVLLGRGLSLGQAAGLMGLSNWELQKYASNTPSYDSHTEKIHAHKRIANAFKIFGVSK
tara:strand:- start:461 stop:1021 length:561 start_codon:yes stop_codon:yes gene_type:complete